MRFGAGIETMAQQTERARDRSQIARRLLGELGPYTNSLLIALVFIFIGALAQAAAPWLVSRAIDVDIGHHDKAGLARRMLMLLGVYVAGSIAGRAQTRHVGSTGQHVLAALRARLFLQLQRLPLSFFDKRPIGDLMSRLLSDVDTLNQLLSQGLTQLLGALLGLVGILVAMLVVNWRLALACYTIIPAMLLTTAVFARRARAAYRKTRKTVGDVTADLQEEIVGVRQAQAFNRTEKNIERFRGRNAANRDANVSATGVTSAFPPAIDVLSTLSTALVIGYGGWLVAHDRLSIGTLAAFLLYVQGFFRPVQLAASVYTLLQSALAGGERVYAILDEAPEAADTKDAIALETIEGRIEFDHVSFAYSADRPVLSDVSFTIAAGQTVALVGRTGAGKTTVASLIPRFYDVTGGSITLDGHDLRSLTRASVRKRMAMVLQEPFLFSGTVGENIAYARPTASRDEIIAAARVASAHEFIELLPKGYDTPLGEAGGSLSQGQRQLVAFARAVLADPRVLILDEATANVDTRTEQLLQSALKHLLAGRTSVVIAHRLSTIRDADLILLIDDGKVAERGTHEELMKQAGLYADLYRRQFRDPGAPVAATA